MHPKVADAIQEIDAALFNGDTFDDSDDRALLLSHIEKWTRELGDLERREKSKHPDPSAGWKRLGEVTADFILSQLRRPSPSAPVHIRSDGAWRDSQGVVHAVNATRLEPAGIDLGRETACGSTAWDPDHPSVYPTITNAAVDCMTCVVRQARSCL